jgi:alanine racemase
VNYKANEIGKIFGITDLSGFKELVIKEVSIDTRTLISPTNSIFFALPGEMNDGHNFIDSAHSKGVRNFVIKNVEQANKYPDSNFFLVDDVLDALQMLASYHQQSFKNLRKIAITGSNGKTIIKEWLYQMLFDVFNIVKSPKSYNSQIGMALSLLGIEEDHDLGIFEAGISKKGEMERHHSMLNPEIGLITNIGSAHDEGFASREEKLKEKLLLFKQVETIVYCKDNTLIDQYIHTLYPLKNHFTWGSSTHVDVQVVKNEVIGSSRFLEVKYQGDSIEVKLRFSDKASFENCMHCIAIMCHLDIPLQEIMQRVNRISGLHMRMEMTTGMQQSIIVNDAYSADLDALQIALEFVEQQAGDREKLAILSAFEQSGKEEKHVFGKIIEQLIGNGFSELVYISNSTFDVPDGPINVEFYPTKEAFLKNIHAINIKQKVILIKGARQYELEDISDRLSDKGHSTTLQINLNALEQNLRVYKNQLKQSTGIIAVVKASAYGTGSSEIARILERNQVAYLAVAFADEGIALRQAGIETKIMVFNPDLSSLPDIIRFELEPEVYDLGQLNQIVDYTNQNDISINIHLKLDTGMHRLGFLEDGLDELCTILLQAKNVNVNTIFSHLASSEDEADDEYSSKQFDSFDRMYDHITGSLLKFPKRHILNSGGISRFPNQQYDFVRLGIGMYGIDKNPSIQSSLRKVHGLYASLIQVKNMKFGDSIGYNRKTILSSDKTVGIVNIGYADGLMRNLGNGKFSFNINGSPAEILGNVCMDLTIVDLSNIPEAKIGEQVVIFDDSHSIESLAKAAGTIPYEILSRISSRVKRKFVRE